MRNRSVWPTPFLLNIFAAIEGSHFIVLLKRKLPHFSFFFFAKNIDIVNLLFESIHLRVFYKYSKTMLKRRHVAERSKLHKSVAIESSCKSIKRTIEVHLVSDCFSSLSGHTFYLYQSLQN